MRCNRLVPRAGLLIDGGPVCPSCARYFRKPKPCPACGRVSVHLARDFSLGFSEKVCERCRRLEHRTCSICRKHRKVYQEDATGQAICKACVTRGYVFHPCPHCGRDAVGPDHALCEQCQIRNRLEKRFRLHLERLETTDGRSLFEEFFRWFAGRRIYPKSSTDLDRNADFFEKLDKKGFSLDKELSGALLLQVFDAEQMRRATISMQFLQETREIFIEEEVLAAAIEKRRIASVMEEARSSGHEELFEDFNQYLGEKKQPLSPRTVRVYLRSALSLLERTKCEHISELSQKKVRACLKRNPGLRASATAFLAYLRELHGLKFSSVAPREKSEVAKEDELIKSVKLMFRRLEDNPIGVSERKALTAFILSKLYGLPLGRVLTIKKHQLEFGPSTILAWDGQSIEIDPRVAKILSLIEPSGNSHKDYLFQGRLQGRPLSRTAVAYWTAKMQ